MAATAAATAVGAPVVAAAAEVADSAPIASADAQLSVALAVALAVKLAVAPVAQVARAPKKRNWRFVQAMAAGEPAVALAALAAELSAKLAWARPEHKEPAQWPQHLAVPAQHAETAGWQRSSLLFQRPAG